MATGVSTLMFDGKDVNKVASECVTTTVDVSLPNGDFIRVKLTESGNYEVTFSNYNEQHDGVSVLKGNLSVDVASRLEEREGLRQMMLARQEQLDEEGDNSAEEWLKTMDTADKFNLFTWGETGGMFMSIPQRLAHLWRAYNKTA